MADKDNTVISGGEVGRLIAAALIGGLIGAGVGLLLAPKTGAELRLDIKDKAGQAAEKVHGVQAKAKDLVETAKSKIEERRAGVLGMADDVGMPESEPVDPEA